MKILLIVVGALVGLVLLVWVGLQIRPAPLPAFPQESGALHLAAGSLRVEDQGVGQQAQEAPEVQVAGP